MADRKQARPRLDAIKRHILAGSYDDVLWEIKGAIEERNRRRQESVMKLVKEVYGEGFAVIPANQTRTAHEILPGESLHVQMVDTAETKDDKDDEDLGPDYESRSPVIGSIDRPED